MASLGPVRLLSIDGGGIRGLSALVLLEQVMDAANEHRRIANLPRLEPWQMFDMIGGTSTGGLIAIMLGRLKMSMEECKKAYIDLAEVAFTPKNALAQMVEKVAVGPKFKTKPLEESIRGVIGKDWQTALLLEDDPDCKVFVVAHIQNVNKPAILRNYRNFLYPAASANVMHIWQACRATSAALTFFENITVDGTTYSDGGLFHNNPVQIVHGEASEMFKGREQLMISLGTGRGILKKFDPKLLTVANLLANLATETEETANEYYRRENAKAATAGRYFRFNVPGIGDIGMDESQKLHDIKLLTETYLEEAENSRKVDLSARQLARGAYPVLEGVPKKFSRMKESSGAGGESVDLDLVRLNTKKSDHNHSRKDILNWLSPLSFTARQIEILADRQEGTCSWFLKKEEVVRWVEGKIRTLWVRGGRGVGKTILIATLVEYLQGLKLEGTAILKLYLESRAKKEQTASNLIASILQQLVNQSRELSLSVSNFYDLYCTEAEEGIKPPDREYPPLIRLEASRFQTIFFIIDGLDECDDQTRLDLLYVVNQVLEDHVGARFLTSSRIVDALGANLKDAFELSVAADSADIDLYITRSFERLANLQKLKRRFPGLEPEIKNAIMKRADGMFLLAKLQIHLLEFSGKRTKTDILRSLHQLPFGLDETYEQTWEQITSQGASEFELAKLTLLWVCFTREPLTVTAIQHALFLAKVEDFERIEEEDLEDPDDIVQVCNGLIVLHKETNIVRFEHYTAEIFFSNHLAKVWPTADRVIAHTCLRYLSMPDLRHVGRDAQPKHLDAKFPLLKYATTSWGYHAKLDESKNHELRRFVLEFLSEKKLVRTAMRTLALYYNSRFYMRVDVNVVGFHLASFFGLKYAFDRLFSLSGLGQLDLYDDGFRSPLLWACYGNDLSMVEYLLNKGARVTTQSGPFRLTVLMMALGQRNTSFYCDNLIVKGVNKEEISDAPATPLAQVVQLVSIRLSDSEDPSHQYYNSNAEPFTTSADIIDLLIRHSYGTVDTCDVHGRTALSLAAENQQLDVVQRLLEIDADIERVDAQGMTPLLWLLQAPRRSLHIGNVVISGNTVAHLGFSIHIIPKASIIEHENNILTSSTEPVTSRIQIILRLIGNNVDAIDTNGRTALSLAAESGLIEVVVALLDKKADVNQADFEGMTPLMYASKRFEPLKTYFNNVVVGDGARAILGSVIYVHPHFDCVNWPGTDTEFINRRSSIVRLLLSAGALISPKNNNGLDALDFAEDSEWGAVLSALKGEEMNPGLRVQPDIVPDTAPISIRAVNYTVDRYSRLLIGVYSAENLGGIVQNLHHANQDIFCENITVRANSQVICGSYWMRGDNSAVALIESISERFSG